MFDTVTGNLAVNSTFVLIYERYERVSLFFGFSKWTIFNGWTKWKSWKSSFSRNARIHGSRHRRGDCCHAMPWRQQPRSAQARGAWITRQHTEDRQLYNRTFPTSRAHRGSLSKRRELVLSTLFFYRFLYHVDQMISWMRICWWPVDNFKTNLCSSGMNSDIRECYFWGLCEPVSASTDLWPQEMFTFLKMHENGRSLAWACQNAVSVPPRWACAFVMGGLWGFMHTCLLFQTSAEESDWKTVNTSRSCNWKVRERNILVRLASRHVQTHHWRWNSTAQSKPSALHARDTN